MRFRLLQKRPRWTGRVQLTLLALEDGVIERLRLAHSGFFRSDSLMEAYSDMVGIDQEWASVSEGQEIQWVVTKWPSWSEGETIDSDYLQKRPGPTNLEWHSVKLI